MSPSVPSRVVLVTGAAGGLGQALVSGFAAQGWQVVAACRAGPLPGPTASVWPVELDVTAKPEIGEVALVAYVAADDCGVALNHMLVEGQVHGGIVQGGVEKLDIPFTPSRVWEALATKA